jgi:hypothetical protein
MGVWRAFLQAGLNPDALAFEIKDGETFSAMQRQSRSHTRPGSSRRLRSTRIDHAVVGG